MKRWVWFLIGLVLLFTTQTAHSLPKAGKNGSWNLAFKQPVQTSGYDKGFEPEYAVDGLYDPFLTPPQCWRRSGKGENWIEVTFPAKANLERIELLLSRGSPGLRFEAWARLPEDKLESLGVFDGKPDGNGLLSFDLPKPRSGITGMQLDMLDPGFPCIHEFGLIGILPDEPPAGVTPACLSAPDIIYHHANVITMNPELPTAEAVAIRADRIYAVGSTVEVLSMAGPCTTLIDLEGRTLMPGFVEGHSHAIRSAPDHGHTREYAISKLLQYGVTTVNELSADQDYLNDLFRLEAEGRLRMRVNAYPEYNTSFLGPVGHTIITRTWYRDHDPILDPYRMLRIPAVKIFVDGSGVPGHGCPALTEPYPKGFRASTDFQEACLSDTGDLHMSQDELNAAVLDIQKHGYRAAMHAMGDAAIDQALNAIAMADATNSSRHQIHHNSLVRPDQILRYASLGILPSVRGYWNTCDQHLYAFYFGTDRQTWAVNRFALINEGVRAFGEGDFAWGALPEDVTSSNPMNPFLTIYGLVTHRQVRSDGTLCEPEPWAAVHRVNRQTALEMVTINTAYTNSQENFIGSIVAGKLADLIVISDNPLLVEEDRIPSIQVLMTMVNGNTEFCGLGYRSICP